MGGGRSEGANPGPFQKSLKIAATIAVLAPILIGATARMNLKIYAKKSSFLSQKERRLGIRNEVT
jgi:hypothetical protein